jgi:ABC-2 type transport system ATP-binding protein
VIRVNSVCQLFESRTTLDGVSFEVRKGELFALLGANGAGKSTLLRILTTLLFPSHGTVQIGGLDVTRFPHQVRRLFGVVFQESSLDKEATASENLELHGALYGLDRHARRVRSHAVLQDFGLLSYEFEYVKNLSGGLARRLEIARALLHQPPVLILDEPTAGLDTQHRRQLWSLIKEMNCTRNVTVLLTTHYLDEADRLAGRVAILNQGRIAAVGEPKKLMQRLHTSSLEEAYLAVTAGSSPTPGMDSVQPATALKERRG